MSRTKDLTGICSQCRQPLSFPAELAGTSGPCPHCGKTTDLFLAPPPVEPLFSLKAKVLAVVALLILLVGVLGPVIGLKRFQKRAARQMEQKLNAASARTASQSGFALSRLTVGKGTGSSGLYVLGGLTNALGQPRAGLSLEFELVDAFGHKVGLAKTSNKLLEPGAAWLFSASVTNSQAAFAKLTQIREKQPR